MTTKTVLHVDYDPLDFERATGIPPNGMTLDEYRARLIADGISAAEADQCIARMNSDEIWLSPRYQVAITTLKSDRDGPPMKWLSIKRRDKQPIHDWRDLQTIKNRLVGAECEAIELYPAESRLVDEANQFHLWCFTDPTFRLPLGWHERTVGERSVATSKQRPFAPEHVVGASVTRAELQQQISKLLDVLNYARNTLDVFTPEFLRLQGLDVLREKVEAACTNSDAAMQVALTYIEGTGRARAIRDTQERSHLNALKIASDLYPETNDPRFYAYMRGWDAGKRESQS